MIKEEPAQYEDEEIVETNNDSFRTIPTRLIRLKIYLNIESESEEEEKQNEDMSDGGEELLLMQYVNY